MWLFAWCSNMVKVIVALISMPIKQNWCGSMPWFWSALGIDRGSLVHLIHAFAFNLRCVLIEWEMIGIELCLKKSLINKFGEFKTPRKACTINNFITGFLGMIFHPIKVNRLSFKIQLKKYLSSNLKVCYNRYSWGAGKQGSEYIS